MTPFDWAMAYCAQGWSLYPQKRGSKTPPFPDLPKVYDSDGKVMMKEYRNGWLPVRTTKPLWQRQPTVEELELWFKRRRHNIALTCGAFGGIVAIDFDNEDLWLRWSKLVGAIATPSVRSSRGMHQYFQCPPCGLKSAPQRLVPGMLLEFRGEGMNVTAPPSVHASGHVYDWTTPFDSHLARIPPLLEDALERYHSRPMAREFRAPVDANKELEWICRRIASAVDGNRHEQLRRGAWRISRSQVSTGIITAEFAAAALGDAARRAGISNPDPEGYAMRSIRNAMR